MDQTDYELFDKLRGLRSSIAAEKRLPAYTIFPDKTLMEMATLFPTTPEALETIYGVGKTKMRQYGDIFLGEITQYIEEKKAQGEYVPNYFAAAGQKPSVLSNIEVVVTPVAHAPIFIENFAEIREELDSFLDFYRKAAYTPENLRQALADRASLNKLKKALQVKNKEIKDICLEPYKSVQIQFKDLIALIDAPLKSIDDFTSEMKQVQKDEKSAEIKMFFDENATSLGSVANEIFSKPWFYDSRWENKSYKDYLWKQEIREKIANAAASIRRIQNGTGQHAAAVVAKYVETGSLIEAGAFFRKLKEFVSEAESNQPEHLPDDKARLTEWTKTTTPLQNDGQSALLSDRSETGREPTADYMIKIKASDSQFQALMQFMESNGIEYAVVMKSGER